jgi:hypothetical protein
MITVEARSRCICGYFLASYAFPSVRVNKCSLRQQGGGYLRCEPLPCPECGFGRRRGNGPYSPLPAGSYVASPWVLTAESEAEVEAYRAKRWPG